MLPTQLLKKLPQSKSQNVAPASVQTSNQYMDMTFFPPDGPDIYDPAFPNDFVAAVKERDRLEKERRVRAEREKLEEKQRKLFKLVEEREKMGLNADGTPISSADNPPINLDESLEEMLKRRQNLTEAYEDHRRHQLGGKSNIRSTFAEEYMSKHGFIAGSGLGKDGQGIIAPIVMEQNEEGMGEQVMLDTRPFLNHFPQQSQSLTQTMNGREGGRGEKGRGEGGEGSIFKEKDATTIVMLRNLTSPNNNNEVEELKRDMKEECAKYGNLLDVRVENAIGENGKETRIFLCYSSSNDAYKACCSLHERMYDGRLLQASFYDPALYNVHLFNG